MRDARDEANDHASQKEEPLVVMMYKRWLIYFLMFAILWIFWFSSFGSIIPYLTTGDFAEIWPSHEGSTGTKIVLFIFSWISLIYFPTLVQYFRLGDVKFYKTYVEVIPYLRFFKKRTIIYSLMHAKNREGRAIVLINGKAPEWRKSPFNYWKAIYWQGIVVTMSNMVLVNSESVSQATHIINERALSCSKL